MKECMICSEPLSGQSSRKLALRASLTLCLLATSFLSQPEATFAQSGTTGLKTKDINQGETIANVLKVLLGNKAGVTVSNVVYKGGDHAIGSFTGGTGIIGFASGIIMTSGDISGTIGPNSSGSYTGTNDSNNAAGAGDPDLDGLIPGYKTYDATILEFDFIPEGNAITFKYVFCSEEYNEWVYSSFNDVFGFFANGVNYAKVAGDAVSINTINNGDNYDGVKPMHPEYYVNNVPKDADPNSTLTQFFDTQMDGFTKVLTFAAPVVKGKVNHIKLAIADAGDSVLDSAVFLQGGSFATAIPISGYAQTKSGSPIKDAKISFSDGQNFSTDSKGYYYGVVMSGWTGNVTCARLNYQFTPTSRSYNKVSKEQINQNFIAQPNPADLLIKRASDSTAKYSLNNIYQKSPSGDQIKTQSTPPDQPATFQVKVENDGKGAAQFFLKAEENSEAGWQVRYLLGTTNITSEILGIGYELTALNPSANQIVTVEMTPQAGIMGRKGKSSILKVLAAKNDAEALDSVKAVTTVTPDFDAAIVVTPDPVKLGNYVTASITVTRTAYTEGFRLDFYRNLSSAPDTKKVGDNVLSVAAGTNAVTQQVKFKPTAPGDLTAWVQIDREKLIAEADETNNAVPGTYTVEGLTVSGTVNDDQGQPLQGVTLSAANASATTTVRTATSDANGDYTVTGLIPGLYIVTPKLLRYAFDPESQQVSLSAGLPDATGINFTGIGIDLSATLSVIPDPSSVGTMRAEITVTCTAKTQNGCWVDLYYNRSSAPVPSQKGDAYFYIPKGTSGTMSKTLTFAPTSIGSSSAWVQVDTAGNEPEIDENNNVTGPFSYSVFTSSSIGKAGSLSARTLIPDGAVVDWALAPPSLMVAGMNYQVVWKVGGGKNVSHTYVVASTDPEPTRKPLAMTEIQSGKPGEFKAWVPAPSTGKLYYQVVVILDGRTIVSPVASGSSK